MNNIPFVSICVLTYNQEDTISKTLDSILSQKVDFPIEIIIGEDCSVDNTRAICLDYQNKYPEIIRLILHKENQGLLRNYKSVIESCEGKYIAQCAGDDYWNDDDKLNLQAQFLDENPEYGLVHTNVHVLFVKSGEIKKLRNNPLPEGYVFEDMISNFNYISAMTVMFRRDLISYLEFDKYIDLGFMMEDYPMWLEFSKHTKFHYIDQVTGVYRKNVNSISHSNDYLKSKVFLENTFNIRSYFYSKYPDGVDFDKVTEQYNTDCLFLSIKYKNWGDVLHYLKFCPNKTLNQRVMKFIIQIIKFKTQK